jgi:hypothetical protein
MEAGVMIGYLAGWKMRCSVVMVLMALLNGCATAPSADSTSTANRLHHVVIVWLKQTGDTAVRQKYIEASKAIAKLSGVVSYELGSPATIKRRNSRAADESYDVAVDSVFESQQAYEAFLKDPEYGRIAQDLLRPMVEKYQVFDFIVP